MKKTVKVSPTLKIRRRIRSTVRAGHRLGYRLCTALLILLALCVSLAPCKPVEKILIASIPRCGTHLVAKCVGLLTGKEPRWCEPLLFEATAGVLRRELLRLDSIVGHLIYSPHYDPVLKELDCAVIFNYRDPRDYIVSYAHHIKNWPDRWQRAKGIEVDELMFDLMQEAHYSLHFSSYFPPPRGVKRVYETYMKWQQAPNILVIRFEDLIGPKGGGSAEVQYRTVCSIAEHLQLDKSPDEIRKICSELFGEYKDFRRGKIGDWRKKFTEQHRKKFEQVAGGLIEWLKYPAS